MNIEGLLLSAVSRHQSGDLADATRLYRFILAAEPCHADALHLLGMATWRGGNLLGGLKLLAGAWRLAADPPGLAANLNNAINAASHAVTGPRADDDAEAALEIARVVLSLSVADSRQRAIQATVLWNVATRLVEAARYSDAEALCRRLLIDDAEDFRASHLLAICRRRQGDMDGAIAWALRAMVVAPHEPVAYTNLASLRMRVNDGEVAERHLRRVVQLTPEYLPSRIELARFAWSRKDKAAMAAMCRKVICIAPDHADAYHGLGGVFQGTTELAEREMAVRAFHAARILAPSDGGILLSLVAFHIHTRNGVDAARDIVLEGLRNAEEFPALHRDILRAVTVLVDYSVFDPRIFALSMPLARRYLRDHPRDDIAFYVIAHKLYLDGKLSVLERFRRRVLKRFSPGEVSASFHLRIWYLCHFDGRFFDRLSELPDPETIVPPVSWRGDVVRFDRPVVFMSCDDRYWRIYGDELIGSIFRHCSRAAVHVNLIDPTRETLENLDRWRERFPGQLNTTIETTDDTGLPYRIDVIRKIYFSCIRLIRLRWLLDEYDVPMVMLDLDCLVLADVYRLIDGLAENDLVFNHAPEFGPTREYVACYLHVAASEAGRRFADLVARYIMFHIAYDRPYWMLDQAALYCAHQHLLASPDPPKTAMVGEELRGYCVYDYRYDKQPLAPREHPDTATPPSARDQAPLPMVM